MNEVLPTGSQQGTHTDYTQFVPDEVLVNIFSYLHFRDLVKCLLVEKRWLTIAGDLNHRVPNGKLTKIVYEIGLKTSFDTLDSFQREILE